MAGKFAPGNPVVRRSFVVSVTAFVLFMTVAAPASAHSELVSSIPADRSTVPSPLYDLIELTFAAPLAEGSAAELREAPFLDQESGTEISPLLDVAVVDGPAGKMSFPKIAEIGIGSGDFVIAWTSVADDGHSLSGTLAFGVAAPGSSANSSGSPTVVPSISATAPVAVVSEAPPATQTPNPTAAAGGVDLVVPVLALLVVAALGAALLVRRRGSSLR